MTAGEDTVTDDTQLPLGTLTGTLTNPDGSPAAGVDVEALSTSSIFGSDAFTDANGAWSIPVFANDAYIVRVDAPDGFIQYAPGQAEFGNGAILSGGTRPDRDGR